MLYIYIYRPARFKNYRAIQPSTCISDYPLDSCIGDDGTEAMMVSSLPEATVLWLLLVYSKARSDRGLSQSQSVTAKTSPQTLINFSREQKLVSHRRPLHETQPLG